MPLNINTINNMACANAIVNRFLVCVGLKGVREGIQERKFGFYHLQVMVENAGKGRLFAVLRFDHLRNSAGDLF
jgi:hypothetical protein